MLRRVRVRSDRNLTPAQFAACHGRSGFWWLRDAPGNFIKIGEIGQHRGDQPFDAELELKVGVRYTLGVGQGRDAIRQEVVIAADADEAVMTVERALARVRAWITDGSQILEDDRAAREADEAGANLHAIRNRRLERQRELLRRVETEGAELGKFLREQTETPHTTVDAKLAPLFRAWSNLNTGRDLGGILGA